MTLTIEVDVPADLARFRLPDAVAARLHTLLDRQDSGLRFPKRNVPRPRGWSTWRSSSLCYACE
jgi:hypothetical protein